MAWVKVNNGKKIPPIPVGQTYTNSVYLNAPVWGGGQNHNQSVIINTKKAKTLTIQLYRYMEVYASGSQGEPGHYTWESSCDGNCVFNFIVNGRNYSSVRMDIGSKNNGWVRKNDSNTITISDLPKGECEFQYNISSLNAWQNGGQLDPHFGVQFRFTIVGVT